MVTPTYDTPVAFDANGKDLLVGNGGSVTVQVGGFIYESALDNITAHAGGGQANAMVLLALMNRITTVATVADSVALPISAAGLGITVTNASTTAMQVYGQVPDTINGIATGTGIALAAGKTATYYCYTPGAWHQQLGA